MLTGFSRRRDFVATKIVDKVVDKIEVSFQRSGTRAITLEDQGEVIGTALEPGYVVSKFCSRGGPREEKREVRDPMPKTHQLDYN